MRRTSVAGWPSETNHSANRLARRSAALSQNSILNPPTRTAPVDLQNVPKGRGCALDILVDIWFRKLPKPTSRALTAAGLGDHHLALAYYDSGGQP
jgi:hypothetical protein